MKISIVTVCFNSGATIRDALRSVAQQSHADIEHIVIDGASKDNTLGVIEREGQHVCKLLSEPDRGIYDAMNKGMKSATGHFVGFLNADDILADRDAVARMVATIGLTQADIVFSDLEYVRQDDLDAVVRYWRCGQFSRRRLRMGWMPPHPTFYVRRDLLVEIGAFDIGFSIAADYDFMLRAFSRADVTTAQVPGVMVRMRNGGVSNRSLAMLWRKSSEDLIALRRNRVGGWATLVGKNLQKLPQYFARDPANMESRTGFPLDSD